jgi:glycosyltransferase involved in cell wall biosynthesis
VKIAVYTHLHRTYKPTGVGKHIINMARGLHDVEGDRMTLLTANEGLDAQGKVPADGALAGLPVRGYGMSRRTMERLWLFGLAPRVDRWVGDCQWLYTPSEAYLPAKRVKVAATCHCVNWFEPGLPWYGHPDTRKARRWMGVQFKKMFERSDVVFAVSEFLKGRIVELFRVKPEKIRIVGNGVEHEYFAVAEKPIGAGRERDKPYVLVVGGLTERKGGGQTLEVAKTMREKLPGVEMLVAGGSEPAFTEASKSHPNVVHVGYRGIDTLPALMRNAQAVLFLSVYETFGIPAAEAMAAGVPIIVSNLGALPEVVGNAGVAVDLKDPGQAVAEIARLMEDHGYRADLVARGKIRARGCTWEACVERVRTVLDL